MRESSSGVAQVVDLAFKGSVSRIGGMSLDDLQREAESFWLKVGLLSSPFDGP